MSEPKWTPAQRAAMEDRGGALLVSAAAGSGKTAVLTERDLAFIGLNGNRCFLTRGDNFFLNRIFGIFS